MERTPSLTVELLPRVRYFLLRQGRRDFHHRLLFG